MGDYMFKELTNDPFYNEYKKYDRCVLDYFIIESNLDHKDVLLYAMNKIKEDDDFITIDKDKMAYNEIFFFRFVYYFCFHC